MGADVCELVVYTQNGAVTFQVKATADNFEDRVAEALEEGTVILESSNSSVKNFAATPPA